MDYLTSLSRKSSNKNLKRYLDDIREYDLFEDDGKEELATAIRAKTGDEKALEELCLRNLRFVISVAKKYRNYNIPLEDLIQAGNLGMLKAAKKFDETRGFKFISYAVWWIDQSIKYIYKNEYHSAVRIPQNMFAIREKTTKGYESFLKYYDGMEPTPEQLIKLMKDLDMGENIPKNEDQIIKSMGHHVKSFDVELRDRDNGNPYDVFEDVNSPNPKKEAMQDGHQDMEIVLSLLDERERKVVCMYLGIEGYPEKKLWEIGEEFGFSRERARQIKKKALEKLKNPKYRKLLINLVD